MVRQSARVLAIAALCGASVASPVLAADPAPTVGDVALDRYFAGAVIGLKGTTVRLRYDFPDAAQMKDWVEGLPFPIKPDAGDGIGFLQGRLNIHGSAGVRHKAEWEGDLVLTCKMIPDGVKDIGAFLLTPDAPTDYVTYTIAETYFHGWDRKAGGDTGMMKFGKQWATAGGSFNGFRYLTFRPLSNPPTAGHVLGFTFGRRGTKDVLEISDEAKKAPEISLESMEPGNRMKVVVPGFYAVKSSLSVDEIVVEGTLSPRWLEANHVALRTEKPLVAEGPAAAGPDAAVAAMAQAYAKGEEKSPSKLIAIVADPTRAQTDRDAAAGALKAGPHRALALVIDLLYSTELAVRTAGIDIVKGLTGKGYGYDPHAGDQARRAAVKRLNDDIQAHPELLQGGGG